MPMKREDGGPAFPVPADYATPYLGMSLRDYFAGEALKVIGPNEVPNMGKAASLAYNLADAMLKARGV